MTPDQPVPAQAIQPASTDEDLLPVVDADDQPIGVKPRRQVHLDGLLHRAVQICLVDPQGRLWLQQRSAAKDTYPGYWDLSCTGHVDPGESYEEAARRELHEELGIAAAPRWIAKVGASAETGWEFQSLYWLPWAGALTAFNPAEISQMRSFSLAEIERALRGGCEAPWPATPGVVLRLPAIARAAGLI